MSDRSALFTVGHSTHSLEVFLDLLFKHKISAIADVRSTPYSRYFPHFNKDALAKSLKKYGIKYVFLGRELGARCDDPSCYVNGRVQYSRLAERPEFQEGIDRVKKGAGKYRIALMCAEREPLDCHRTLLVSRALDRQGLNVEHIHSDGHSERHRDAMERLLDVIGLSREDFFLSKEELMAEALSRQEERVAYTDEILAAEEAGATI
ncbi:MAG: DUF488 domain-containing protein [bacterium]|nr:DUF488 domain-containing protein [bacterium]